MKSKLLIANHMLLFLCASMYLGTGGSLVLFSFPTAAQLTPDNYYLQFVPQVQAATSFFTQMTKVMFACAAIMLIAEWRSHWRWVPIVVIVALATTTALTLWMIFPLNAEMAAHIQRADRLHVVLADWMQLNRVRVAIWCVQWAALALYFGVWTRFARYPEWAR
ncbi:MAG TPA: hypothetical protein VIL19_10665 [Casimicrobiaceae bacterium]